MTAIYTTTVTAVGGRMGSATSDDGVLAIALGLPREMGGSGANTNPEQLFAAGYAACFGNALIHVSRGQGATVRDKDIKVAATVGMVQKGPMAFGLEIALDVTIAGLDQQTAETVVGIAHQACPYSNAVRGNIDVAITVAVAQ